jgi:hypothetical protein
MSRAVAGGNRNRDRPRHLRNHGSLDLPLIDRKSAASGGETPSTTPSSYGSRLATMVYGLLLVIESW